MERNSTIKEYFMDKFIDEQFPLTDQHKKLTDSVVKMVQEFIAGLDDETKIKYLNLDQAISNNQLEFEILRYCEGLRAGFKLCMDIFNL